MGKGGLKVNTWMEIKPQTRKFLSFYFWSLYHIVVFFLFWFFFFSFFKCAAYLLKHIGMPAFAYVALSSNKQKQGLAVALSCCPFQLNLLSVQYYICLRSDPYLWRWKRITSPLLLSREAGLLLWEPVPHHGLQTVARAVDGASACLMGKGAESAGHHHPQTSAQWHQFIPAEGLECFGVQTINHSPCAHANRDGNCSFVVLWLGQVCRICSTGSCRLHV